MPQRAGSRLNEFLDPQGRIYRVWDLKNDKYISGNSLTVFRGKYDTTAASLSSLTTDFTEDSRWRDFGAVQGFARSGGTNTQINHFPVYSFPTTGTSVVRASTALGPNMKLAACTVTLRLMFAHNAAATGDVDYDNALRSWGLGSAVVTLGSDTTGGTFSVASVGGVYRCIEVTKVATGVDLSSEERVAFMFQRNGSAGTDTLAVALNLLGGFIEVSP